MMFIGKNRHKFGFSIYFNLIYYLYLTRRHSVICAFVVKMQPMHFPRMCYCTNCQECCNFQRQF